MNVLDPLKLKMESYNYVDYLRQLKNIKMENADGALKPLRIAILRSYSAEMIEPPLHLKLILEGYNPSFFWGDYNQYAQEILDENSRLYKFEPNFILFLVRIDELMPDFIHRYGEREKDRWKREIVENAKSIVGLISSLNNRISTQILIQNMCITGNPYWGIYDAQESDNGNDLLQKFNRILKMEFSQISNIAVWDYQNFLIRKGYDTIFDPKLNYVAKNPFQQSAYIDIADDMMRYISSMLGKTKKCIVLDLDNTLWGGIVGEDGFEGIALGHDYPGSCYVDFQRELLKLYHRGVILAINSKNNESDSMEVIDKHPDMILRRHHFAAHRINWNDKASNMRLLAEEINIGIESMIFLDDNPAECELVRQQCPECTVIQIPKRAYLIPSIMRTLPGIENIHLTDEDKKKGEIYQAQTKRKNLKNLSGDLAGFLKALEMEVEIKKVEAFTVPRISQLTQKTNQFNMTTRRYTEADIQRLNCSDHHHVFSITARDRFGDNGIIGVIILEFVNGSCRIDTFLLSCRVISRTIENSMVAFIAEFAQKHGLESIIGEFFQTPKNKPAGNFYARMNFKKVTETKYCIQLNEQQFQYSPYIKHHIA